MPQTSGSSNYGIILITYVLQLILVSDLQQVTPTIYIFYWKFVTGNFLLNVNKRKNLLKIDSKITIYFEQFISIKKRECLLYPLPKSLPNSNYASCQVEEGDFDEHKYIRGSYFNGKLSLSKETGYVFWHHSRIL